MFIGGIYFGSAKPVPVDNRNFKHPDKGMAIVAFAGPLSNILLGFVFAIIMSIILKFFMYSNNQSVLIFLQMLQAGIIINFFLAFFNLLPIPPLDGSRIVKVFLSYEAGLKYYSLESFGFIIIIVLWQAHILNFLVGVPASLFYNLAMGLVI
jgi:Zn-dependent protease